MTPDSQTPPAPARPVTARRRRWPVLLALGLLALVVVGGFSFVAASALEEHDSFCISCHTVPETTYYNRAYFAVDNPSAASPDLATYHYLQAKTKGSADFACIDCHRGDSSLGHRVSTLVLGGRDAVIYVTGQENATIEKTNLKEGWLANQGCLGCHTETLLTLKGIDNHFHTHLPEAANALDKGGSLKVPDNLKNVADKLIQTGLGTVNVPLLCSDCHQPHKSVANGPSTHFIQTDKLEEACISCHRIASKGPQEPGFLKASS